MGRLRSGKDAAFLCRVAKEVTDLFGTADGTLFRFSAAEDENLAIKDPLWDEPELGETVAFESFDLPVAWSDWNSSVGVGSLGREDEIDAIGYLTVGHLLAAGVPKDSDGEFVGPGDVLSIHSKCGHEEFQYDILQTNRDGWVDSSDQFTGYQLELKRRDKYLPERKTS